AIPGAHHPPARSYRLCSNHFRVGKRSGQRDAPRIGRPWQARRAHWRPTRRKLARLVRRIHGQRTVRRKVTRLTPPHDRRTQSHHATPHSALIRCTFGPLRQKYATLAKTERTHISGWVL